VLNKITVTFEGDHIRVRSDGEKNCQAVEQIWSKVSRLCEKHRCFALLGIGDRTKAMEVVEGCEYPGVFREYDPGRLFPTVDEARKRLLGSVGF
jgi:hypothetical protein